MNKYIIDLHSLRTSVFNFLSANRSKITLYSDDDDFDRRSIEDYRQAAIHSNSPEDKAEYKLSVSYTASIILASLVQLSVCNTFKAVPKTYNSIFNDLIVKLTLPSTESLFHLYEDQDDQDIPKELVQQGYTAFSADDAAVLFDDLYVEAIGMLDSYDLNPNSTVKFEIINDVLQLEVGIDYRVAIYDAIFKDDWKGPAILPNGSLDIKNATFDQNEYLDNLKISAIG